MVKIQGRLHKASNSAQVLFTGSIRVKVLSMLVLFSSALIAVAYVESEGAGQSIVYTAGAGIILLVAMSLWLLNKFKQVLNRLDAELKKVAKGDYTAAIHHAGEAEVSSLYGQFNESISQVRERMLQFSDAIQTTISASGELNLVSSELDDVVQKQTGSVDEVQGAIEEMVYTILGNAEINAKAAHSSKESGAVARQGGEVVQQTIAKIQLIAGVVGKSVEMIENLGRSIAEVEKIVANISDISTQTNLLALNAAIEAARAGEQGRGFAVVADEVRALATRTTVATKDISRVVGGIQSGVQEVTSVMVQSYQEVEDGTELANRAGEALEKIVAETRSMLNMMAEIASASDESATTATDKTAYHLDRVSTATGETESYVREGAQKLDELKIGLNNWQQAVERLTFLGSQCKTG